MHEPSEFTCRLAVDPSRDLSTTILSRTFCGGVVRELMGAGEGATEDYRLANELWYNDHALDR